jgi:DNA-binding transcriptional LysR family regulator
LDKLSEFQTFLEVAQLGSFSRAAASLGITPSAASKQIKALEERLGARLFNRTTRRVSMTDAGRAFRDRIEGVLREVDEAEQAVADLQAEPRGLLQVGAPMDFGRGHLAQPIARFAALYPDLEVRVELSDRFVDVVEEGFDVVVRIGELAESSLVARRLAPCRRVICATPDYLDRLGRPTRPEDLTRYRRVGYAYETDRSWHFDGAGGTDVRVNVPVSHRSNNGELTRQLLLAGEGIAMLPTFIVSEDLRSGRLEMILRDATRSDTTIHALYPHRKHLSAKVRHFVDYLVDHCGPMPYWDEGVFAATS